MGADPVLRVVVHWAEVDVDRLHRADVALHLRQVLVGRDDARLSSSPCLMVVRSTSMPSSTASAALDASLREKEKESFPISRERFVAIL